MDKRQCQNCGAYYDAEKGGCPYCQSWGAPGEKRSVFVQYGQSQNTAPRPAASTVAMNKPAKKKGLKAFLIALLVVALVGIGVLCYIKFAPKPNIYVSRASDTYLVNWNKKDDAVKYNVYIDGQKIGETQTNDYEITTHLVDDTYYQIKIEKVIQDGTASELYTLNYNYQAATKNDFARKPSYFIMGKTYDYVIDSTSEYEAFVWYNILYRNSGARCYINTSQITRYNADSQTRSAISNYPEYDAVEGASRYASYDNNVVSLVNFRYYLPIDFTKATADVTIGEDGYQFWSYVYNNDQYEKNTNFDVDYITASDKGEARNFAIDTEDRTEVVVNNTEQLFWAVQYGARPIFAKQDSVAATCYNNAKQVLAEINSDSLSDYQKAYNIYVYLCTRVTYDHVLLDYMTNIAGNSYVNNFGHFNVFYIESILYDLDNQVSVCDGIAKTFTLLCQIEGIDASKINGRANIGAGAGAHAWNRVCIDDNWYIVDCTWGVASYGEDNSGDGYADKFYEAFTYAYFLVSEEEIADTHEADYQINNDATISYNFYKNHTVSVNTGSGLLTIDLYIENDEDLENLKKYMYYSDNNFLNVKFAENYLRSMCDYGVYNQQQISDYIKEPIYIGLQSYGIASWLDYDMCFLIIGAGSDGSLKTN